MCTDLKKKEKKEEEMEFSFFVFVVIRKIRKLKGRVLARGTSGKTESSRQYGIIKS